MFVLLNLENWIWNSVTENVNLDVITIQITSNPIVFNSIIFYKIGKGKTFKPNDWIIKWKMF